MSSNKIIVALDSNNLEKTLNLVSILKKEAFAFKIGYEFFLNYGLEGYNQVKNISSNIFLDLKLHDIPNTVENGVKAINKLRPKLTTIHISGGDQMIKSSLVKKRYTKVLGVSVLTSFDNEQTYKIYNEKNVLKVVKKFASLAKKNRLDGIVCSPQEIKIVRKILGKNFLIVTPGIRLSNKTSNKDDQKRFLKPDEAINLGANFLVIGRPITRSKDPLREIKKINDLIT